jgi:mannose/fructose/N-acetylgalactosamine-specific phosphotransferase system component IIC
MTTALVVFLNIFFIGFVLVTIVGLQLWGIASDRTMMASIADQRARLRATFQRRPGTTAPAARRQGRALDFGA